MNSSLIIINNLLIITIKSVILLYILEIFPKEFKSYRNFFFKYINFILVLSSTKKHKK